ncbi:MAG: hypothetical protein WB721_14285, partial [Pseudolabrys sp.]
MNRSRHAGEGSFDHFVGKREQLRTHFEADRPAAFRQTALSTCIRQHEEYQNFLISNLMESPS